MKSVLTTPATTPHTYFENSVGRLLEHPAGHYISVEYRIGPRQLSDLHAFLSHVGQLLAHRGWDKLLGHQGLMTPFTPEKIEWITGYWRTKAQQRTDMLYGALLLPHEVFARLPVLERWLLGSYASIFGCLRAIEAYR